MAVLTPASSLGGKSQVLLSSFVVLKNFLVEINSILTYRIIFFIRELYHLKKFPYFIFLNEKELRQLDEQLPVFCLTVSRVPGSNVDNNDISQEIFIV